MLYIDKYLVLGIIIVELYALRAICITDAGIQILPAESLLTHDKRFLLSISGSPMMWFSDIIAKEHEKGFGKDVLEIASTPKNLMLSDTEIAKVLSDTQILKVRGKRALFPPPLKEEWRSEVITYYEKFVKRAMDTRDRVWNDQGISPSPILSDLHYILNQNLVEELYEYAMFSPGDYDGILIHDVRVTFVALIVGKGMGYDLRMLLKLGLAGLLENVGMYKIPEDVLQKQGPLNDEEMAMIRDHPKRSYEVLAEMGEKYNWLAEVALQVHERADGSGYPYGLKRDQIYELSFIIGLCDVYVAMITDRSYRDKFVQTDAIKYIVEEGSEQFPTGIRRVFLNQISLFPVNTYVRLNNKSIGRVLCTDKNQPLRPTIELVYDSAGHKMVKRELIQLSENPLLYITESLHERDIP
jgi:HD-GYP domain-containing protein (c-di-GMP phosphodiesterase class II)